MDQGGVSQRTTGLATNLDQLEVDISAFQVGDTDDGVFTDLGNLALIARDHFGTQTGHSGGHKELVVVLLDVDFLRDLLEALDGEVTSLLETVRDLKGVEALIKKEHSLFQDGAGKHHNTCGTITDFVILGAGELDQESGSRVLNFHLLNNGGSIIGYGDFTVGGLHHLVHTLGSHRGTQSVGNRAGSSDVET